MHPLSSETLDAIRRFDTCTIANAIERFGVRLRNEGYTKPGLRCVTGRFSSALGYAATCQVRSGDPPMTGGAYEESTDWWGAIEKIPAPRFAVVEDVSKGSGSVIGEVHAAILKAFHCAGAATNGAVRDLPGVNALSFPLFAGTVTLSHAYAHMVSYGTAVELFGLCVHPGDLLFGDCHGVIKIPLDVARDVARVAGEIRAKERRIIDVCLGPDFTTAKLKEAIESKS